MLVAQPPRKPAFNRVRETPRARILLNERLYLWICAELLRDREHAKSRNDPERNQDCQDLSGSKPSFADTNLRQGRHHLRNSADEFMRVVKVDSLGKLGCIGRGRRIYLSILVGRRFAHM